MRLLRAKIPARVRVNIVYERDLIASESADKVVQEVELTSTPPPVLELEGYENEVPSCSCEEIVVTESPPDNSPGSSYDVNNESDADRFNEQCMNDYFIPKKRTVRESNVLRFANLDEMETYCSQNNLDSNMTMNEWLYTSTVDAEKRQTPTSDQFIYSIDPDYASTSSTASRVTSSSSSTSRTAPPEDCAAAESADDVEATGSQSMVECRLCQTVTTIQKRKQHIYQYHLKKPLYRCPLCPVSHRFHKAHVSLHLRRWHRSALKPIQLKYLYEDAVNVWMYKCFSDRRLVRCIDPEAVSTVYDLLDWVCEERTSPPNHGANLQSGVSDAGFDPQQMPEDLLEPDVIVDSFSARPVPSKEVSSAPARQSRPSSTCNLCAMVNVKHIERHVLQHHVKRPMFLCPFCTYSSNYAASSVKDHIRVKHSLTERAEPIDIRDENWAVIRRIYDKCFPLPGNIEYPTRK